MATFGVIHFNDGGHLHIVGESHHESVFLRSAFGCVFSLLWAEVLPKRCGALHQSVPGGRTRLADFLTCGKTTLYAARLPFAQVFVSVILYARLTQTAVRLGVSTSAVSRMDTAHPLTVGIQANCLCGEKQTALAAAVMGETTFAEIPQQDGHLVVSLLQEWGNVHLVIIGILGCGATLELAFKYNHLSIYPQPIFGSRRYACLHFHGDTAQGDILAESNPCVLCIHITFRCSNPTGFGHKICRLKHCCESKRQ